MNLLGQKFSKLTVISFKGKNSDNRDLWECICECGNHKITTSYRLRIGKTKSCGCLYKETAQLRSVSSISIKIRRKWDSMIGRCYRKNDISFKHYGGRGITVCDEWKNSFDTFKDWAVENGFSEKLSLERKDNNGNYYPSNCKWATTIEQAYNTQRTIKILINGEYLNSRQVEQKFGINQKALYRRIKLGFSGVDLVRPLRKNGKKS